MLNLGKKTLYALVNNANTYQLLEDIRGNVQGPLEDTKDRAKNRSDSLMVSKLFNKMIVVNLYYHWLQVRV